MAQLAHLAQWLRPRAIFERKDKAKMYDIPTVGVCHTFPTYVQLPT
jgi:hypothetical protein